MPAIRWRGRCLRSGTHLVPAGSDNVDASQSASRSPRRRMSSTTSGLKQASISLGAAAEPVVFWFSSDQRIWGPPRTAYTSSPRRSHSTSATGSGQLTAQLVDEMNNVRTISASELRSRGLPWEVDQIGPGDDTAPQVTSLWVSSNNIDSSTEATTVYAHLTIEDELSGFTHGDIRYAAPGRSSFVVDGSIDYRQRVAGDATDGEYVVPLTFPRGGHAGSFGFSSSPRSTTPTTLGSSPRRTLSGPPKATSASINPEQRTRCHRVSSR